MFHFAGDDVPAARFEEPGGTQNREVAALGAAAGKHNLTRFAFPTGGNPVSCIVEEGSGLATDMVNAGRISKDVSEIRQHGFPNRSIERRGGVVV